MDTSAFEEDDGLDVNVVELYQTLPEDVQQMVSYPYSTRMMVTNNYRLARYYVCPVCLRKLDCLSLRRHAVLSHSACSYSGSVSIGC